MDTKKQIKKRQLSMKHDSRGMTLIELLITAGLFSLIVAMVAGFAVYYFRNYSFSFEEQQVVGQSQAALTKMIREIRKARTADDGSWPLLQTNDTSFVFYAEVTGDDRTDRVRYFLDGTDIKRGVIEPTAVPVTYPVVNEQISTLISSIEATSTPIFRYYNGNWPQDTVNNPLLPAQRLLQTRYVHVTVNINPTPNFAASAFTLQSGVSIRSLKDNL